MKEKVTVLKTTVGKYDCDSITVVLNKEMLEICFDKNDDICKYEGREVYLSLSDGVYFITPIENHTKK